MGNHPHRARLNRALVESRLTGMLCRRCCRQRQAVAERSAARDCQRNQALKMLENSQAAMHEMEVGTNVRVGVPDVDRSRRDHANLIGVVIDVSDERIVCALLGITRLFYNVH